jgi:hypothetical protein
MANNWEQKRRENTIAGMVDLPAGKLDGLSDKQKDYYLSLRGAFRNGIRIGLVSHEDRVQRWLEASLPSVREELLGKGRKAAESLVAAFDDVPSRMVMDMKIDSLMELILCRMSGLCGEVHK